MRLLPAVVGLVAALAGPVAAHAETWLLIDNPNPGYKRFKTAVRIDNLERSDGKLLIDFLVVEKGKTTPEGHPVVTFVQGEQTCYDKSHSRSFLRLAMSGGPDPQVLSKEEYPPDGSSSRSMSTNEIEVAMLFCTGVPGGVRRIEGDPGDAAVELMDWAAKS